MNKLNQDIDKAEAELSKLVEELVEVCRNFGRFVSNDRILCMCREVVQMDAEVSKLNHKKDKKEYKNWLREFTI